MLIDVLHTRTHDTLVLKRRIRVLARSVASLLPDSGTVLDVGCGNGEISAQAGAMKPDLRFSGIDVVMRRSCAIPMSLYDGREFPFADKSYDYVTFVDVLHHTTDPMMLLSEARRVAREGVVIKDHLCDTRWGKRILGFMDWVGNSQYGVALPSNFWSSRQWGEAWEKLGVQPDAWITHIGLYPRPFRPLFEDGLHFLARIPTATPARSSDSATGGGNP